MQDEFNDICNEYGLPAKLAAIEQLCAQASQGTSAQSAARWVQSIICTASMGECCGRAAWLGMVARPTNSAVLGPCVWLCRIQDAEAVTQAAEASARTAAKQHEVAHLQQLLAQVGVVVGLPCLLAAHMACAWSAKPLPVSTHSTRPLKPPCLGSPGHKYKGPPAASRAAEEGSSCTTSHNVHIAGYRRQEGTPA
jgi:hypothetical protein